MATKFAKWNPDNAAAAAAYLAEANAQYAEMTGVPGDLWSIVRLDRNGNHTVPLLGPPWVLDVAEVEEPPSCALLRIGAVVVDFPEWPEVEE